MLNAKNCALAGGILWGLCILITTLVSVQNGYAADVLANFASMYPGYEVTNVGAVIGAVYGFIDAFVGLYIFAWLYNKLGGDKKKK